MDKLIVIHKDEYDSVKPISHWSKGHKEVKCTFTHAYVKINKPHYRNYFKIEHDQKSQSAIDSFAEILVSK